MPGTGPTVSAAWSRHLSLLASSSSTARSFLWAWAMGKGYHLPDEPWQLSLHRKFSTRVRKVPGLLDLVVSKKVGRCKYREWTQVSLLGGKSKAVGAPHLGSIPDGEGIGPRVDEIRLLLLKKISDGYLPPRDSRFCVRYVPAPEDTGVVCSTGAV